MAYQEVTVERARHHIVNMTLFVFSTLALIALGGMGYLTYGLIGLGISGLLIVVILFNIILGRRVNLIVMVTAMIFIAAVGFAVVSKWLYFDVDIGIYEVSSVTWIAAVVGSFFLLIICAFGIIWTHGSLSRSLMELKLQRADLTAKISVRKNTEYELSLQTKRSERLLDEYTLASREAQLLHNISKKANAAELITDALKVVLDEICSFTQWPVGHAYLMSDDGSNLLVSSNQWHMDQGERFKVLYDLTEATTFKPGIGLPGRVLESRQQVWVNDVNEDSNFTRSKLVCGLGIKAAFAFPIMIENNVFAVLEFFSEKAISPNKAIQRIVIDVATQLSLVLKRQLAVAALHQSEQHLSEINTQLSRALLEAESSNKSKDQFLANMNHELRTPLNAVIGFSDLLLTTESVKIADDVRTEYIQNIHDSGKNLLDIINDILDMTKLKEGRFRAKLARVDVTEIIDRSLSFCEPSIVEKGIRIEMDVEDLCIISDQRLMKKVLINIISNAVKYSKSGGIIELSCATSEHGTRITITDTGIGMSEDELHIALEPFSQVDGGLNRMHEGTGLGLPLALNYMQCLGGELEINSTKHMGTTVILLFADMTKFSCQAEQS